jgi:hypothetical protein
MVHSVTAFRPRPQWFDGIDLMRSGIAPDLGEEHVA